VFDTIYSQVGAVFTVLVAVFAFVKGDEPERVGAGAFLLAALAGLLIQDEGAANGPHWGLMALDIVLLAIFGGLVWKSRRAWPVWACALQALIVSSHIMVVLDLRPPAVAFYTVINLAGYGDQVALAVGTCWGWQVRRAAGLE
jgi:hypothetical protein